MQALLRRKETQLTLKVLAGGCTLYVLYQLYRHLTHHSRPVSVVTTFFRKESRTLSSDFSTLELPESSPTDSAASYFSSSSSWKSSCSMIVFWKRLLLSFTLSLNTFLLSSSSPNI